MPDWLELSVGADAEAVEAVSEILQRVARGGVAIEPPFEADREGGVQVLPGARWTVKAYLPATEGTPAALETIEAGLWHLNAIWPVGALQTRAVNEDDWANAWKAHYHPIRIGRRIVICPRWRTFDARPDDVVLLLDPGMAFGTGLHPTTQLCLEATDELTLEGRSVLDLGCGSGILAIAAAKLGAGPIAALDIDGTAVRVATENAEANGVSSAITVGRGSLPQSPSRRYDVVFANIIAQVIADLADDLYESTAPGGVLVASGVINEKRSLVVDRLRGAGFALDEREQGDWLAFIATRPRA